MANITNANDDDDLLADYRQLVTGNEALIALYDCSTDEDYTDIGIVFKDEFSNEFFAKQYAERRGLHFLGWEPIIGLWRYRLYQNQTIFGSSFRALASVRDLSIDENAIKSLYVAKPVENALRNRRFNDELFPFQWNLGHDGFDYMGVKKAWDLGYTGKNVTICVVDDGVDYRHPDLRHKFRMDLSFNMREQDRYSNDPFPESPLHQNSHGTQVAGVALAEANNGICGVGIAYGAYLSGITVPLIKSNSFIQAMFLAHLCEDVDIKNFSFGPVDGGYDIGSLGRLVEMALAKCVTKGRHGLGTILVHAAGNGGLNFDHAGADPLATSRYGFGITSVDQCGTPTHFSEAGSGILAATYAGQGLSLNSMKSKMGVCTSFIDEQCSQEFSGTSAAAPLAAGIFALVLEANPRLTYRDLMHIVVKTARKPNLDAKGWQLNGAGHYTHDFLGFGVLDAGAMVIKALDWVNVGELISFKEFDVVLDERNRFKSKNNNHVQRVRKLRVSNCPIRRIEHVVVTMNVEVTPRSGLRIQLVSPSGTKSTLIDFRPNDDVHAKPYAHFPFTTKKCWGENPEGIWTLTTLVRNVSTHTPQIHCADIDKIEFLGTA